MLANTWGIRQKTNVLMFMLCPTGMRVRGTARRIGTQSEDPYSVRSGRKKNTCRHSGERASHQTALGESVKFGTTHISGDETAMWPLQPDTDKTTCSSSSHKFRSFDHLDLAVVASSITAERVFAILGHAVAPASRRGQRGVGRCAWMRQAPAPTAHFRRHLKHGGQTAVGLL